MEEIKRIKRDPIPQLTIKKSIEDQFKVSKAVADAVEDPETALGKRNLEKTKENLDRGWLFFKNAKAHLARRQVALRLENSAGMQTPRAC